MSANIKFSQLPNLNTITANTIIPVVSSGTNYTVTTANLQTYVRSGTGNITAGTVSATGNITGNYIFGNGSQLTGLPATYGNANVAAFLPDYNGNIGAQSISNVDYVSVESSGFAQLQYEPSLPTDPYNINTGSWLYIDATGGAFESNITGNIQGVYFGNDGAVSATGNVTSSYVVSNGSALTNLTGANVTGNVANATFAISAGTAATATSAASAAVATTAGTVTTNAQPNITSVGVLSSLSASGNVTGAYIKGNGSSMTGIVTSIVAGSGISVNSATGTVTITNTGNAVSRVAQSFAAGTAGNTTTEIISASALIPANTFSTNDVIDIEAQWISGNTGTILNRYANVYINTSNTIPGNTLQVSWLTPITTGPLNSFAKQRISLDIIAQNGNTRGFSPNLGIAGTLSDPTYTGYGASSTNGGGQAAPAYLNINWSTDQYIIFCVRGTGNSVLSLNSAGYQIYKK